MKTIQIKEETHSKFKDYCKQNNLKINSFIDTILDEHMEKLIEKPFSPKEYIKQEGITIVSSDKELELLCKEAIEQNDKVANDYKSGNEKALFFLS